MTTLRAQLRAAIADDPRPEAQIARDAGMEPAALSRLLREDKPRDGALSTWERVAAALGLRVALVRAEDVKWEKCGACNSCIQGAPCGAPIEVDR